MLWQLMLWQSSGRFSVGFSPHRNAEKTSHSECRCRREKTDQQQGKRQPRDLKSEALIPVLERKLLAIIYADREEEIRAAI